MSPNAKFQDDWIEKVLEYGAQGMTINTIAIKLGVSHDCLYDWARRVPELRRALDSAMELAKGWWEEMARINLCNPKFSSTLWMMVMSNRYGYNRYLEKDNYMPTAVQINNFRNRTEVNLKSLTNDELKNLDQLISKTIADDEKTN